MAGNLMNTAMEAVMEAIDPKYLKGLKYKTSEAKEEKGENGRKKRTFVKVERALKPEDILSWADQGDAVVLVTADGQKLTVAKEPEGKKKGGD